LYCKETQVVWDLTTALFQTHRLVESTLISDFTEVGPADYTLISDVTEVGHADYLQAMVLAMAIAAHVVVAPFTKVRRFCVFDLLLDPAFLVCVGTSM
jgi:hypothetical protein